MSGGVEQAIVGLASGLSSLEDGDEEYLFVVRRDGGEWLRPYVDGPCRMVGSDLPPAPGRSRRLAAALPGASAAAQWIRVRRGPDAIPVPRSDGTVERLGANVVHFPSQGGFLTDVPTLYQPWDLQHVHLPELFTPYERLFRDVWYGEFCRQAQVVVVPSEAVGRDVTARFGVPPERVVAVAPPPPIAAYAPPTEADREAVRARLALPEDFLLYPGQTWPHKNHVALLEALALLRDERGVAVHCVCTGRRNAFFETIERRVRELRLEDQIRFVGYVSNEEMYCLYELCRGLVFPSRFEGWGLPVGEALLTGVPVACSRIPPLEAQTQGAALLFDPADPGDIAAAVERLWTDGALREELAEAGRRTMTGASWEATARDFRDLYRAVA